MPKVISYTRFSSRRQAQGDSYRRQTEAALKWCLQNGHELDTTLRFEDLGVSAANGKNARQGALGTLREMARDGQLEKGTILLIEAFDRLTRLPLPEAYEVLLGLINNGITVVTVMDGKVWTQKSLSDLDQFLLSLMSLYKGHRESADKADRLRATFEAHRSKGSRQAFGSAPGWLRRDSKTSPWQVIEEKAESVRLVFELAAQGFGSPAIAARANEEGWPVPTRLSQTGDRWHAQMPGILLRNRAVLGEHEHRIRTHAANAAFWRGTTSGVVHADYYPRIISDELWAKARVSIEGRKVLKRRDANYWNIWSGLLYCGYCGAPVQRKTEYRGQSRGQLVCADRLAGVTKCPPQAANKFDEPVLNAIHTNSLLNRRESTVADMSGDLAAVELNLSEQRRALERVTEALLATDNPVQAFVARASKLESAIRELESKREQLLKMQALSVVSFDFDKAKADIREAMGYLYDPSEDAREKRATLHLRLARIVDTIWLYPYSFAHIKFKSGANVRVTVELPAKSKRAQAERGYELQKFDPPAPRRKTLIP